MKLTPSNISSVAAIPNGSIIKKVDDDNFAEVVQSDITALGIWWWVIEKTETFIAWESISSWDHVSLWYYREQQLDSSDIIKTYNTTGASTTVNYWQAFDRPVSSPIVSITPSIRLSTLNESWWWILNFSSSTSLWWSSIVSLSYQISKDWIWRTTLWAISSTSWGNETSQNSISIPANHYFRWSLLMNCYSY